VDRRTLRTVEAVIVALLLILFTAGAVALYRARPQPTSPSDLRVEQAYRQLYQQMAPNTTQVVVAPAAAPGAWTAIRRFPDADLLLPSVSANQLPGAVAYGYGLIPTTSEANASAAGIGVLYIAADSSAAAERLQLVLESAAVPAGGAQVYVHGTVVLDAAPWAPKPQWLQLRSTLWNTAHFRADSVQLKAAGGMWWDLTGYYRTMISSRIKSPENRAAYLALVSTGFGVGTPSTRWVGTLHAGVYTGPVLAGSVDPHNVAAGLRQVQNTEHVPTGDGVELVDPGLTAVLATVEGRAPGGPFGSDNRYAAAFAADTVGAPWAVAVDPQLFFDYAMAVPGTPSNLGALVEWMTGTTLNVDAIPTSVQYTPPPVPSSLPDQSPAPAVVTTLAPGAKPWLSPTPIPLTRTRPAPGATATS
jgi:hypothetical protein